MPRPRPTVRLTAGLALVAASAAVTAQPADPMLGRNLAATCANCHGTSGNAKGDMKSLAGASAEKILAQLADFRSGNQPATIMHQITKGYTEDQLKAIAAYFAAQKPAAK
jgi:cytochrome c553